MPVDVVIVIICGLANEIMSAYISLLLQREFVVVCT